MNDIPAAVLMDSARDQEAPSTTLERVREELAAQRDDQQTLADLEARRKETQARIDKRQAQTLLPRQYRGRVARGEEAGRLRLVGGARRRRHHQMRCLGRV
jgi:hypothetical protein